MVELVYTTHLKCVALCLRVRVPPGALGCDEGQPYAPVAQWLEQRAYTSSVPDKHMVVGSNPTGGTFDKQLKFPGLFRF